MKRFFAVLVLVLISAGAWADTVTSGSVSVSVEGFADSLQVRNIDWASDAAGRVTASLGGINGTIERVVVVSDSGLTSPTNLWDMTLKDRDSLDILGGKGANISVAAPKQILPVVVDNGTTRSMATIGPHNLAITNAGNTRGGIVRVYLRR
jgi:hypothetical protein